MERKERTGLTIGEFQTITLILGFVDLKCIDFYREIVVIENVEFLGANVESRTIELKCIVDSNLIALIVTGDFLNNNFELRLLVSLSVEITVGVMN